MPRIATTSRPTCLSGPAGEEPSALLSICRAPPRTLRGCPSRWRAAGSAATVDIDAVGLAGRQGEAVLVGEAKWAQRIDGRAVVADLERRGSRLPRRAEVVTCAVCARSDVGDVPVGAIAVTAADIFGG